MGQLYGWMHQLPVIGFNSGKYDFNATKRFLIPYFLFKSKTEEQEEEEEKEQEDKEKEEEYGETVRPCWSIVGYDANALYLWSLMQDMPMGW